MTKSFEETVADGLDALRAKQETLLANYGSLSQEVHHTMEELTRVKNACNSFAETDQALRRLQLQLDREARRAYGDPLARFCAREENCLTLNALVRKVLFPAEKLPSHLEKALTGVDTGLGQATVPSAVAQEIYQTLAAYGQWNTLRVLRVGARTVTLPYSTARPTCYILGSGAGGATEGAQITEGSFTGGSVSLTLQTLAALVSASRELLADATVDMSAEVLREIAQSVAYRLDWICFAADGTADQTDGGYRGLFEAAGANTNLQADAAPGNDAVNKLDLDDFLRCLTTVNAAVLGRPARWWIHPTLLAKMAGLKDANGRPIFQTALEAPAPGAIGSILGYPVVLTQAAPSTDAAGAKVAVFGDPEGGVVGLRQDLELATADQWKFDYNLVGFRGLVRAGFVLRTATASTTLKPFAVLTLAS
jgi:HK97 family phage major capsid protein